MGVVAPTAQMEDMRWQVALAVVAVTASSAGGARSAGGDPCQVAWWPQPQQSSCASSSADNTSAPSAVTVQHVALAWTFDSQGSVSAPVVDGGVVYVQTQDAQGRPRLHALELASGKQTWEVFGGHGNSPPYVDGDVLLRLSSGWLLRRYGLRHGDLAWARPVATPSTEGWTGIPVVADGNWYLSTGETLVAYGERVGRLRWTRDLACSTCGVAAAAGRVYAAGGSTINALDAHTGATVWSTRLAPKEEPGSVVLAGGRLFTVTMSPTKSPGQTMQEYAVEAYSAADGRHLWHADVGSAPYFHMGSAPSATAALVVYPSPDGYLYALDARTGDVRWRHNVGPTDSVPAVVNGLAWLVAEKSATLVAFTTSNGRQVWSTSLGKPQQGSEPSPVVARETVLLPMPDGRLLAYRTY